tara:strand:- start:2459 stop:3358 length:900 start_codon:yes stop_codon:yes gene_type:complete
MNFLRRILPPSVKKILRAILIFLKKSGALLTRSILGLCRFIFSPKIFLAIYQHIAKHADLSFTISDIVFDGSEARPLQRAKTILTKEPDTIHWIDNHFSVDDVFYDIGANIGVFSLYAAKKKSAQVFAFEPMCTNYDLLNKNIFLNNLSRKILAFNIAFDNQNRFSTLHLSAFLAGKSGHGFAPDDDFESVFEQGMYGMTLDSFIFDYDQPFPRHIKIDVDGNEPRIISGMRKTLTDTRLRSIAVELMPKERPEDAHVIDKITNAGFEFLSDQAYVNQHAIAHGTVRNHFFIRKDKDHA